LSQIKLLVKRGQDTTLTRSLSQASSFEFKSSSNPLSIFVLKALIGYLFFFD
jgi:hypothetical protein